MTSYLSSLSGHVANIRRLIPTSLSPDSDLTVSDPNDSHVSRVLRAYYTEKGRPFPPWLGPDPRTPQQTAPVYASTAISRGGVPAAPSAGLRSGRGLGDLFGDGQGGVPLQQETMSLRQPRRPVVARSPVSSANETAPSARPMPSQRAGSYQSRSSPSLVLSKETSMPDTRRGPSAQDRLKARFGGSGAYSGSTASNRFDSSGIPTSSSQQNSGDNQSNYGSGSSGYSGRY